jgi:hypothetical protein
MVGPRVRLLAIGFGLLASVIMQAVALPRAGGATGGSVLQQGRPTSSVFHIAKSENRNQVHYGIKVDEQCRPRGDKPVYGYWRDYEDGPKATSPLLDREQSAYGLTRPRKIELGEAGGKVHIGLRGFPDRKLEIQTFRGKSSCRAWAMTLINRHAAVLGSIYVELGFLFSIDYVLLKGVRISDGSALSEKVND